MGALFDSATDFWTLRSSARLAARGCRGSTDAARLLADLEVEVLRLQRELRSGGYTPGPLRSFTIREPKCRSIAASPFRDRVVHHAICATLDPILEASADHDSFACRRGKGTLRAVRRVQDHTRRFDWFAKLDVLHCFETVDLDVLRGLLRERVPDGALLDVIDSILVAGAGSPGRGLPIGSLTSQHFANLLLGEVDREARRVGVGGWVRYMDDMFLFGADRESVTAQASAVATAIEGRLHQQEKLAARRLARTADGVPALGFRVWPRRIRLDGARRRRLLRRLRAMESALRRGGLAERDAARSAAASIAWAEQADTLGLRRSFVRSAGR